MKRHEADPLVSKVMSHVAWPLRLTWAGLWAERISHAFWPLWSLLLLGLFARGFDLFAVVPYWLWLLVTIGFTLGVAAACYWGWRRFERPQRRDALDRLDRSLAGRPLSSVQDLQALGGGDPASEAIWAHHRDAMAARALEAKPVFPNLNLAARDPYGFRYMALTLTVLAALFGNLWQGGRFGLMGAGPALALPHQGAWEGWARPPAYTGLPAIYLNDITQSDLRLPEGTDVSIRFYGAENGGDFFQNLGAAAPPAEDGSIAFKAMTSGEIHIGGRGGRTWQVEIIPDIAPEIAIIGDLRRDKADKFALGFKAQDDYGVKAGVAELQLDLSRVNREYGLALPPEAMAPLRLDLPFKNTASRREVDGVLLGDLSESLLANMPISLRLEVEDVAGKAATTAPIDTILPARRFFEPMAAAVAEMRRDLLWNRENLPRVTQLLRAISHRPDELLRSQKGAKRLRVLLREIDAMAMPLSDENRDFAVKELWQIALFFEEGDLASAFERFQRAQDRLEEAIRNGASDEEIDALMAEMQQALRDYMREKAKEAQPAPEDGTTGESREVTQDQIQELLDEIERLTKEGRTAEAMERMEQLRQLMENLQMQQGQGEGEGEGQEQGKGGMGGLSDTLKDQQGLSDEAYRNMQRGRQGRGEGQGEGRDSDDLADAQRDLQQRLEDLQAGRLPGDGTREGEAGRQKLDEAEGAMRDAEEALRRGDLGDAMDHQAEALDAMREGMRALERGESERSEAERRAEAQDPRGQNSGTARDPLGREMGDGARIGSDQNMVENSPDKRAERLLDEIRRRSGETQRPEAELEYLRRLLDLF